MSRLRINGMDLKYLSLIHIRRKAKAVDCMTYEDSLVFLVSAGDMGLAIGRKGANIEKIRKALKKTVVVIEYSEDPKNFIENLFAPAKLKRIQITEQDGRKTAVIHVGRLERGKVIGLGGQRIRLARKIAQRHHGIQDITLLVS